MKRFPPYVRIALFATLFAALLAWNISPVIPRASAAPEGCGSWQVVHSPPLPQIGGLYGVSASSHTDAWAAGAGAFTMKGSPINSGIIEHWNGTRWSSIPSPQPANYRNDLYAVAALSPSDAWAVGSYQNAKNGYEQPQKTLIEHWDGTRWSVIASPNKAVFSNGLSGVTALSPNDIWAVGGSAGFKGSVFAQTLIEHWDGMRWSIMQSPNVAYDNGLTAVTALAPDDLWAVGVYAPQYGGSQTLTEHWNGQQWSEVPSPNVIGANQLRAVAGAASNDVWTVGDYSYGGATLTLTEHWDGSTWSVVPSPNPPGGDNVLAGVAALATNNVWAVGSSVGGGSLIHWDGHQWQLVANPSNGYGLDGIAALNAHDIWAAGGLILHYC